VRITGKALFLFVSIFKSLNGGFKAAFLLGTMERKMLFLGASLRRLWAVSIGEAYCLKCLKRRLSDLLSA
jgi:hypothetical protein